MQVGLTGDVTLMAWAMVRMAESVGSHASTRRQYERGYESVQADGLCSEVELLLRECKLD